LESRSHLLAATHKMNYLEPVAFVEHDLWPLISANNRTVELDSNPRGRQSQFIDELVQRRLVGNSPDLTVDLDAQFYSPPVFMVKVIPAK